MKPITVKQVEEIAFVLAKEKFSFHEPIPDFQTRFANLLESCLATPFQSHAGKDLYPGLALKASILFYLMVKNHPFQNGNKRVAMTTLLVFLHLNKKWIKVDTQALYNFAVWVAQSPAGAKEDLLRYIEKFLKKHLVPLR